MTYPRVQLGDLEHPEKGSYKIGPFGSSLKKDELVAAGIPVVGIENVHPNKFVAKYRKFISDEKFEELERYLVRPGDVLVTTMGTVGRSAVAPPDIEKLIYDSHLFRMRVDQSKVFPKYLTYALNDFPELRHQILQRSRGAIMKGLNTTILKQCTIPLPPLAEQQRIAAILDKADALRQKRRAALARLDDLLQATFLDMFGDPFSKLPRVKVEALARKRKGAIRTGPFGSQLLHSEFVEDPNGVMVLGIDNAVQNRFIVTDNRFITHEKYQQLRRYTVYPDDVLITIMGTCGRCSIVPEDIPLAINTKHLCCITLDHNKCLPIFLKHAFLAHPVVLKQLGVSERGAVMPGLNMGIIKSLEIPLPSMKAQIAFVAFVHKQQSLVAQSIESSNELDTIFRALQQHAFRGQL
ncbi:MAG: restriction endonuclease subunit S [Anaerolineae bacterium]|nr:restriction endonuclease subunit S [Anaerolineae bacterium]